MSNEYFHAVNSYIVISNRSPACVLIGTIDVVALELQVHQQIGLNSLTFRHLECVLIYNDEISQDVKVIVTDWGDNEVIDNSGIIMISFSKYSNGPTFSTINTPKQRPFGLALVPTPHDKVPRLYVSYPKEKDKQLLLIKNPFDSDNMSIEYEIGCDHNKYGAHTDGPYWCASVVGVRSLCSIGSSVIMVMPDRVKYTMDVSSNEYGLPGFCKLLRENIQEPFGFVDQCLYSFKFASLFCVLKLIMLCQHMFEQIKSNYCLNHNSMHISVVYEILHKKKYQITLIK